jgi:hypothetical protein
LFLQTCLGHRDIDIYLATRSSKFEVILPVIHTSLSLQSCSYFNPWLSGFVEAEGSFFCRANGVHGFSISQTTNLFIITAIRDMFISSNVITEPKPNFYLLSISTRRLLIDIVQHFTKYPLLGEKLVSFNTFCSTFKLTLYNVCVVVSYRYGKL